MIKTHITLCRFLPHSTNESFVSFKPVSVQSFACFSFCHFLRSSAMLLSKNISIVFCELLHPFTICGCFFFFLICSAFDLIGPPHYNATSLTSHTFWLWLLGFGHTEVCHRPEFFASFVLACCLWRCLQRTSISRTNCFCTGHSLHFTITLLLFFCNKNKSHVCTAQNL